ncbi:hypothetical protein B6D60_11295 [candidate division KSB1 bacterium 4484_87]|nr:MAG: hypothetical protein B6D60_11295 [candidate division KSB1 bacterium 4484_87]
MKSSKTMRTIFGVLLMLLLFSIMLACAGKKPAWGDEKSGYILTYRFQPDQVLRYETDQKQTMTQEMMGHSSEVNTQTYNVFFLKGNGFNDQKNLVTKIGFDTLYIATKVRGQEIKPDASIIVGKEFEMIFSPQGKKIAFNDPESIKVDFGPMAGKRGAEDFFRNPLPTLPSQPVKFGDSWTDEDSTQMEQSGMDITVKTKTVNTLEKVEVVNGIECLKVNAKVTGSLDGSGNQMGADIYFEGDLDGSSVWYFDFKNGKLIQVENKMLMEGTVAVSGAQNMTIPMTQESTTKVRLIK